MKKNQVGLNPGNSIEAVLFDLDQTLTDFIKMKRVSCRAAIRAMIQCGLPIRPKAAEKIMFQLYDEFGIEDPQIFQRFLQKTMRKIDYRLLSQAIAAYRKTQPTVLIPYPNTRQTLSFIRRKGLKIGLVSDATKLKAWMRLAEMGISEFFDVVITLDDTGKSKPHAQPFILAARRLQVNPKRILFVGDNPGRDIYGAKNALMQTCFAKYGYTHHWIGKHQKKYPATKPDFVIHSIAELKQIVSNSKKTGKKQRRTGKKNGQRKKKN